MVLSHVPSDQQIRINPYSDFIVIVGRKATGKTVITRYFLKHINRFIVLDTCWQFGDMGYCIHFPDRMTNQIFKDFPHLIYQPSTWQPDDFDLFFERVISLTNFCFCIDEVDRFASSHGYTSNFLREIINRGRHQGIGLIVNSRRPSIFHKDIRANADYVITFHLHEFDDCDYVAKWMGTEFTRIKALQPYHSLVYDANRSKIWEQKPCEL